MAKTKRQQQQKQQQLLVIYLTTCLVVVSLLIKADSVSASNIPLDGSGNILLQQPQHQHVIDNTVQEHNFIRNPTRQVTSEDDDEEVRILNAADVLKNQLDFGQNFKPITMDKRTPGGFVGMRGKKMLEDNDNNSEDLNEDDINFNLPWNQLQNSDEIVNWNDYAKPNVRRYKKAPNAFYGVRGKKFVNMNSVNTNNDNNRWHDFLQKLEEERVRDAIIQDFVERLAGTKTDITNDMTKRAPTGFMGVRGKRPFLNELDSSMESLSKRGLGNNAFIGVRGKKDVSHQTVKRSPAGPESLPGRSGKRQRFVDFNNKFVAVRGKKSSSYNGISALNAIRDNGATMDAVSMSPFDKRTPKGFLGMRVKRPFATDDV